MGLWLRCMSVCVFVCDRESFLATVACLSWLTFTTWSYLHQAHSAPLDTHTHTLMFLFVSLTFCVLVSYFFVLHSTTFSFSASLHIALYLFFFLSLPLCVVCLCVPSGICVSVLWLIVFSRWSCVWLETGGWQGCVYVCVHVITVISAICQKTGESRELTHTHTENICLLSLQSACSLLLHHPIVLYCPPSVSSLFFCLFSAFISRQRNSTFLS